MIGAITWGGPTACSAIAETLVPSSEIHNNGGWTETGAANMADATDEIGNDSEYGTTPSPTTSCSGGGDDFDFKVAIGNPVGVPGAGVCQGMRFHYRIALEAPSDSCPNFSIELQESSTVKASDSESTADIANTTYTYTLSEAEVNSINDHDDLNFYVSANVNVDDDTGKEISIVHVLGLTLEYYAL